MADKIDHLTPEIPESKFPYPRQITLFNDYAGPFFRRPVSRRLRAAKKNLAFYPSWPPNFFYQIPSSVANVRSPPR
jgi:hypothetical protein